MLEISKIVETVIRSSDGQLINAFSPIEVTDKGITICLSDEQLINAFLPIDFSDEGRNSSVIDEQFLKAFSPIVVNEEEKVTLTNEVQSANI